MRAAGVKVSGATLLLAHFLAHGLKITRATEQFRHHLALLDV